MEISFSNSPKIGPKLNTLVLFCSSDEGKNKKPKLKVSGASKMALSLLETVSEDIFKGSRGESLFFRKCDVDGYENILFVGLGALKGLHAEDMRLACGTAYARLKSEKTSSAVISLDALAGSSKNLETAGEAAAEAFTLVDYSFDDFKAKNPQAKKFSVVLSSSSKAKALNNAIKKGQILGECANFSKWLGDAPGNIINPVTLAKETSKEAKGTGLKVTIWDKARIKKEKMGGLEGVSLGGGPDPRFIIMEYKGAAASKKPVCFVGKGLTFDAGGISIKPSAGMDEMKYDMCGGANTIGTMLAIAKLKLKINAIGYVPASENMLGPMANKPGDILKARNGKTVEVLNTDAEGRLILMDALSYATEKKPAAIVNTATLTGAMVVALGNTYTGFFTRDKSLRTKIEKAGEKAGELVWAMPIHDQHVGDMKGTHADLQNISSFRGAGSSTAAAFLEQFVGEDIPFAHFDIAGTAWNCGNRINYCPKKGATGVMIRTYVELAQNI